MDHYIVIIGLFLFALGFGLAFWIKGRLSSKKIESANLEAEQIVATGRRQADNLVKEAEISAKDTLFKLKSEFDAETKETKNELKKRERRLIQKEENIDRKLEQFENKIKEVETRVKDLKRREEGIRKSEEKYKDLLAEQKLQLEKISGLTADQAKDLLILSLIHI